MAEYIDREEAKVWIANAISLIPSADVQPVVRCINCKHYEGLACCKLIGDCGGTNWFCGWGEPKEET